jgi:hypothetical protein
MVCDLLILTAFKVVHLLGELNRVALRIQLGEELLVRQGERQSSAAVQDAQHHQGEWRCSTFRHAFGRATLDAPAQLTERPPS